MSPFGLMALLASAGSARLAGSEMTRSAANGKPGLSRIGCGNMTFHIDRCRARLRMQRGLAGGRRNHLFDAGQATADHAPATKCRTGDQFLIQRQTSQKTGIAGHNLGRHHHVARFQRRIEPTGDAERDDTPESGRIQRCQQRAQLLRIARTADHDHAGPGRDAGLLHQSCYDQNRPRIIRIAINQIVRESRRPPPPKSHPDPYHPAVGASQISVPRQRPERKELRVAMITQVKHPRKARCRVSRLVPQPFLGLCGF